VFGAKDDEAAGDEIEGRSGNDTDEGSQLFVADDLLDLQGREVIDQGAEVRL
jgi:hypothetical protein